MTIFYFRIVKTLQHLIVIIILTFVLHNCNKKDKTNFLSTDKTNLLEEGRQLYGKKNDSAYVLLNKAYNDFLFQKDTTNAVKSQIYISFIESEEGDYYGSIESSVNSLKFLKSKNLEFLISIYNSIANSKKNLKEYNNAIFWYRKALEISTDPKNRIILKNNIGVAFYENKEYVSALNEFEELKKTKQDSSLSPMILDNFAYTKSLQNPSYNAEPELYKALEIREKTQDWWGQNASHAHLSDYFAEKDKQKSLFHAQKMLEMASKLKSPDDKLEALQKLVLLEQPENSKKYFLAYQKLNDSLQTARSRAKNQFALIRYESEKNKNDFLKSQAENAQKQNRILKQNIALGLSFLTLIIGVISFRKRKKRLEKEKLLEVKNTELKYSKKVHDVVANGLYQIMVEIQNLPEIRKDELLDKLDVMYEKSRDISHDETPENLSKNFNEKLSKMITSYSSDETQVFIIGNSEKKWSKVPIEIQDEIFYILRELMVNMKKHSSATSASIKFENDNKILKIRYQDNGLGINDLENKKGKGMQNTENRMAAIGGEINFEKNPKGGLLVHISIPITTEKCLEK